MGPLTIAQLIICGICLAIGLLHLALYFRLPERRADLYFALMCFSTAVAALCAALGYHAVNPEVYNLINKWHITSEGLLWTAMVWFVVFFTGNHRRWIPIVVSAAYGLAVLINAVSSSGILYTRIDYLQAVALPWGEQVVFAVGPANPWRMVADSAWLLLIYLVIESCVRLGRRGHKKQALFFGASLFFSIGPAYLHGSLVDIGVFQPPLYINFAFLALILIMSSTIVSEVVRASSLSRAVAVGEERWRALMANVNLLAVGVAGDGRIDYVNPHFCSVSGFSAEDLLGRTFLEIVPKNDRAEIQERFEVALQGEIQPHMTRALLTKEGHLRQISWFHVVVRDASNRITGTLSIGEDVTELKQARQALREEKERMDVILSSLDTGLVLLDADLRVVWLNATLRKLFPEGVPLGSKCYNIAEDRSEPCQDCGALKAFADGRIHVAERYNAKIDKWIQIVSLPIRDEAGNVVQVLEATTDLTERKQTEEARDRYLGELEALKAQLEEENIYLKMEIEDRQGFMEIVGRSNAILYVLEKVRQVAQTDATVLVQGETGVGKELIARAIHRTGGRAEKPFVTVNCAALPASLVESELFGHEAGAFTGAGGQRKGRFELADGGTVFLDEISEMPLDVQAKLLRVLQEGQFERVGSSRSLKSDVRVIAATNRNLAEEVAEGRFRPDLYYRLNVYPITVPPLRARREDVPLLVQHFVPLIAARIGKTVDQVPPHVMQKLESYDWPGNVRELVNILERAVITAPDSVIRLPEEIADKSNPVLKASEAQGRLADLDSVERSHIIAVLNAVGWRISGPKGAAHILGLHPSTLHFRMKKLGIRKSER